MGRDEEQLFNGRISEIVRTYIYWQIYESAFLLKWGKLLRRRGCWWCWCYCCCCPWLWGCNGAGERGNSPSLPLLPVVLAKERGEGGKCTLYTPLDLEAAPLSALPPLRLTPHPLFEESLTLSFSSSAGPELTSLFFSPRSRLFPSPAASVSHRCNFPVGDLCDIKVCVVYLTTAPPRVPPRHPRPAQIYRNICRTILPPLFV